MRVPDACELKSCAVVSMAKKDEGMEAETVFKDLSALYEAFNLAVVELVARHAAKR